jgi:glycosyltransferase involved in cell wall biosynthesis
MSEANCSNVAMLIPCFNGLQHLPQLLESANQLERGFDEIIVYDDASTEPFPFNPNEKFPRVKFYRGEINGGAGYARNRLIELATADYIHFHDIDDVEIPKNFLTELAPYLNPNTVVFSSWQIEWLDARGSKLYDYSNFDNAMDLCEYLLHNHIHINATIFPRNLALKVKFDEDFRALQDLLFNIRLAQAGATYRHVDRVITKHTKNAQSTTSRMKQQKFQEYYAKYCQRCREILPEHYYPTIGEIALYYAWNSCLKGFDKECELAISVAQECGNLNYAQFGRTVRLLAPWLGMSNTLKLRRWWSKYKIS